MNLYILGLDESEVDFDPDDNPGGQRDELPNGSTYLDQACALLELLDPGKGQRLRHILEHDLVEDEDVYRLIPLLDLGRIVDLLESIEDDVLAVTDEHWRLRPDKAADVLVKAPNLVYTFKDSNNRTVHTLENTVSVVLTLRRFLVSALVNGLKVAID